MENLTVEKTILRLRRSGMKLSHLLVPIVLLSAITSASLGSETIALFLTGKDQGDIRGDSTQTSLGREYSIECIAFTDMYYAEPDPKNGITGTVRDHFPISVLKRLDRATPKLYRAWRNHEPLEAEFRFFRPNPIGDGTTEQFYTIRLHNAYIAGLRQEVPNCLDPATGTYPPVERISFTYVAIQLVWTPTGDTMDDEWTTNVTKVPLSDLNFDGIVNMKDFVILTDDWMTQY